MAIVKDFKADFKIFWIVVLAIAGAQSFIVEPLELLLCMVIQS